jgi:hypothetical protein
MKQNTKVTLLSTVLLTATILLFTTPGAKAGTASFTESGLPTGITWTVTCNNITKTATTPTNVISFNGLPGNGPYAWSAQTISGGVGIQYVPSPASGSGTSATITYTTQYQVTFAAGSGGSVTTPTSPQWYTSGASGQAISATANTGYQFTSWTVSGSITVASASSASTTITVNGPGTVTANFEVTQIATVLTVACTPESVDNTGATTIISGSLKASDVPLAGKTVVLSYNNGVEQTIGSATTQADGSYTYTWTVPSSLSNGFYMVSAAYTGDNNPYMSSTAHTSSGSGGLFVLPEYPLGVLGALIAMFAAFGIVRIRRKKTAQ